MHASYFFRIFNTNKSKIALIWNNNEYTYGALYKKIVKTSLLINNHNINKGSVVILQGDFSLITIALLFSLINKGCIIVPLTYLSEHRKDTLSSIVKAQYFVKVSDKDDISVEILPDSSNEYFYTLIRNINHPGLVLFTSGTTGKPKAAVHDFSLLLEKFKVKRNPAITINFLLFDHWGGLNTMFHIFSNFGTLVVVKERSPQNICKLIETYKVELLPATPTFLNLLLLSGVFRNYDLSSLNVISYGAEPMSENTLKKLKLLNNTFMMGMFIKLILQCKKY